MKDGVIVPLPPRVGFPKPLLGSGWSKQDGTLGVCTVDPIVLLLMKMKMKMKMKMESS